MVLANYQSSFNGLTWGPGTDIQLGPNGWVGLRGLPAIRSGNVPKARGDGYYAGLSPLGERIFSTQLMVFAPAAPIATVIDAIATAFQPIVDPTLQLPLLFQLPGWATPRQITCRPINADLPVGLEYSFNKVTIPVQFEANDPLVYDSTLLTAGPVGLPSPTAGAGFNATFNLVFGASTGGSLSVTNAGKYLTAPVFTITGPLTNPRLTHPSGLFFGLNLTLGAGDTLVIDMAGRTVILNGTASRQNTIMTGSTWFGFVPGTQSISVGSSDSSAVAGTFAAAWRSAWGFN